MIEYKFAFFIALTFIGLATFTKSQSQPEAIDPNTDSDYDSYLPYQGDNLDSFDWTLAQHLFLKDPNNLVISPFSIKLLLNLLAEAASPESDTLRELSIISSKNAHSTAATRNQFKNIFQSLNAPSDKYDFRLGTKVYVDQVIEPLQRYSAIVEQHYNTTIERLDFKDSITTSNLINEWCSEVTNGRITKIIQPGDVVSSVMIMLNAIYFQGQWRRPFPKNQTVEMPFYLSSTQQLKTMFMVRTGRYYYLDSSQLNSKILRIPYMGRKFAMLIVLPNSKEGLNEFVRQIDSTTLRRAEWLMDDVEIKVALPKFKFDYLSNMNDVLKELGIREVFTSNASLPLLARGTNNQLQLSKVLQKAGIQLDEQGSTVYAATEVSIVNKFGEHNSSIPEFIANRPFLFFIQDETTGTLLFAGKITNPAEFEVPE